MRTIAGARTTLAALVVGGLAVGLLAPAQAEPTPTTVVAPASLPAGAAPTVAWVSGTTLIQPATHRRTALGGTNPSRLLHVEGGYVVQTPQDGDHYRLVFVSYRGKKRVLAKDSAYGADVASTDGRWLVLSSDPYGTGVTRRQHVRVIRVGDGRTIAHHGFAARATVMAAGSGRVLVHEAGGESTWRITGHPVKPVQTLGLDRSSLSPAVPVTPPASLGAKRFVARTGERDQLRGLSDHHVRPSQQKRFWSTEPGEYVLSFSPDDKRVLTVSGLRSSDEDAPWDQATTLRVRSTRTGRIQRELTGLFGYDADQQPVWEDAQTLLLHVSGAWHPVGDEGDGRYLDNAIARCTVGGACSTVASLETGNSPVVLMQHKSN